MNTMLRSSNAPQQTALAPSSLTTTGRPVAGAKVPRGVWIGGGLMALTIVALATALVMKGGNSGVETPAQLAAVPAVTAPAPDTSATTAPVVVAPATQAPVVAQATPAAEPAPAPVHHTARHTTPSHSNSTTTSNSGSSGNTTVASTGGSTAPVVNSAPPAPAAPVCTTCGVVDSYDSVQVAGSPNGVGAVAGGVGGAVLGSQIAGRHNKTLGGVIGAIGGGLLGNEIEKHQRTTTMYDVHVRMNDGSMRTVRQATQPQVGARVSVEGNTLHSAPQNTSSSYGGSPQGSTSYQGGNGGSSFSPSGS
jgi:outer membrane lipoprotein SlyB